MEVIVTVSARDETANRHTLRIIKKLFFIRCRPVGSGLQ